MRFWVFESDFPVFGCQQRLNRANSHRSGIATPHVCCNAVVMKDRAGLVWCEPGCDMEEQPLVGVSTGQQEADPPGIAQDHLTDLE